MTVLSLLVAAVAVLPSDRMAMADRLFDRGETNEALAEYRALRGEAGVPEDQILFRLAEAERRLGHAEQARALYGELLAKRPGSVHADRARLLRALEGTPEQQRAELPVLDAETVAVDIRAAALYHLGALKSDPAMLVRCAKLDPKGRYAHPARFRRAVLLAQSDDPAVRRQAVGEFNELAYQADPDRALEAHYMAVRCCYADQRYSEVVSLAGLFFRKHPEGKYVGNVRVMAAWSNYLSGKYAAAESLFGDFHDDDLDYLRGACALGLGDAARAKAHFEHYLERYPQGRYRAAAELPLARIEFRDAEKAGDSSLIVEAAARSARLSKSSADRLRYAWALENDGQIDQAQAEYEAVAVGFPGTADAAEALYRKAMVFARKGLWSDCTRDLGLALAGALSPARKAQALYWRGIAAHNLPHRDHEAESLAFLKEAVATPEALSLDQWREARLMIADADFKAGREAEAKAAYAQLVREGACVRLSASRIRNLGRFLLSEKGGPSLPDEAVMCGRALAETSDAPEWRQAGFVLRGAAEEASGAMTAAIASYRQAVAQPVAKPTEDLPAAMAALGVLEAKTGENDAADATLRQAVRLLADDPSRRVRTYLWLARVAKARQRPDEARRYATIVTTLFDDETAAAEATQLLATLPEEPK